jgi:flagellar basal body rod protein FlgB
MINRLLGPASPSATLKKGLDETSDRLKDIAHRVSNASTPGSRAFDDVFAEVQGPEEAVSLEDEMIALADGQLRFEASSRLLQKVYQMTRASVSGGGG